jgi:hypothetical protein
MNQLPTIRSYGEYHGQNYGLNCLMVSFSSGLVLYYSYETIVAFSTAKLGLLVRQNDWSTTTGKHLNWIDGGEKNKRISGQVFEGLLTATLMNLGLMDKRTDENAPHLHDWVKTYAQDEGEGFRCESCHAFLNKETGEVK